MWSEEEVVGTNAGTLGQRKGLDLAKAAVVDDVALVVEVTFPD
jgi:hypothetical protein